MTRLIVCVLAFVSLNANAEWLKLPDSPTARNYIEVPVIKKNIGMDYVQAWLLQDFFAPQTMARSMKAITEFDCKNYLVRTLRIAVYSTPMAEGIKVAEYDATTNMSAWYPIPRGTFAENAIEIACKNK
jgi:hypothetical protein